MSRSGSLFRRCTTCGWKKVAKNVTRCGSCGTDGGNLKWGFQLDTTAPGSDVRRRIAKSTFGRKQDAEQALRRELSKQDGGAFSEDGDKMSFIEWSYLWLKHTQDRVDDREIKQRTFEGYRKHITQHLDGSTLGNMELRGLRRNHFRDFYRDVKKAHELSPNTVHRIHSTLRASLSWAVVEGLIPSNPSTGTHKQPRKVEGTTPDPWTEDELGAFLEHPEVTEHPLRGLWHVVAGTGARRSEALGLKWTDWDAENRRLSIRRAVVKSKDHGLMTNGTKNWEGRTVKVSQRCADEIERHRVTQQAHIQWEARDRWTEEGWVFPNERGGLYDPDRVSRDWARTIKRAGIRPIRLHDLRHCHASHLIRGGATPILVQKRLGHKTIEITLGVYGHLFDHDEQTSIEALADRLYGTTGG